jgi:hypothetical protein
MLPDGRRRRGGLPIPPARLILDKHLDDWLAATRDNVRPRTWASYATNCDRYLRPLLDRTPPRRSAPGRPASSPAWAARSRWSSERGTVGVLRTVLLIIVCASSLSVTSAVAQPTLQLDSRFGVAESLANPTAMAELGAGWTRVLLAWHHIQPNNPIDYWGFGRVLRETVLDEQVAQGIKVAGVVQYTPTWAASDPVQTYRAVPRNLYLPYDDPDNYFGQFMYQTVHRYAGRIDEWIIWNEPDFLSTDPGAGESYTWQGSEADFAQLLRVGYLAVKRANPQARVSFPATSYWADMVMSRPEYYDRILDILGRDPTAAANNYYHDAVSVNLYRKADNIYRVHEIFKDIQRRHGIDRPVWLTETNAMPSDDRTVQCWERHTDDPWQTTQQEQAAFTVQALAMASAAGYEHVAWWRLIDGRPCIQQRLWGAVRDDGSWRPAAVAMRTAIQYFSGFLRAQFVPLARARDLWPANDFEPNWRVYQVALDRPGGQRVSVVWNGDGQPLTIGIAANGSSARALNLDATDAAITYRDGAWQVQLPAATASYSGDSPGYHYIGGAPVLVIEEGVDPQSSVQSPAVVSAAP